MKNSVQITLLLVLILQAALYVSATKKFNKVGSGLRLKGKKAHHSPPPPHIVTVSQSEFDKMQQKNEKVDQIYEEHPEGIHQWEEAQQFELYVRILDMINGEFTSIHRDVVYLNNMGVLFIARVANNIREVVDSIPLINILNREEDVSGGHCCENISNIDQSTLLTNSAGQQESTNCFNIVNQFRQWTFCSDDLMQIYKFRQAVKVSLLTVWAKNEGLASLDFVMDNSVVTSQYTFSWAHQESWQGECTTGTHQSPIDIESSKSIPIQNQKLMFAYTDSKMTAKYDGNQVELFGNLGSVTFVQGENEIEYQGYKIQFHFPQQHFVDEKQYAGEMEVYLQSVDGTQAIVSYFLEESEEEDEIGAFWTTINPNAWDLESDQSVSLGATGLDHMFNSVVKTVYNKSFYYYLGSMTEPPCNEGVERFIMKNPIQLPSAIINEINERVFDVNVVKKGNSRKTQHFHDVILFIEDTSINCPGKIPDFVEEAFEKEEEKRRDEVKKIFSKTVTSNSSTESHEYQGKFVKTTANVESYTLADKDDQSTEGETVNPEEVPVTAKSDLVLGDAKVDVVADKKKMRFAASRKINKQTKNAKNVKNIKSVKNVQNAKQQKKSHRRRM